MSVQSPQTAIVRVTRTDDYDPAGTPVPGTLRYACEIVDVPRRVVFDIAANSTITLTSQIEIEHPWLHLSGGRKAPIITGAQVGCHASHITIQKLTINGTTSDPGFDRRCLVIGRGDNTPVEDIVIRRVRTNAGRDDGLAIINDIRGVYIEKCHLSAIGTNTSNCFTFAPYTGIDPEFYPDTLTISDCIIDGDFRIPNLKGGLITLEGCEIHRGMRTTIIHDGRYNIVNNRFLNRSQKGYWTFYDAGRIIAIYEDEFAGTTPASLIYLKGNTYDGVGYATQDLERAALCRKVRTGSELTDNIDTNAAYFSSTRLTS